MPFIWFATIMVSPTGYKRNKSPLICFWFCWGGLVLETYSSTLSSFGVKYSCFSVQWTSNMIFWVTYYLNLDPILLSKSLPDAFHFSWDKPHPAQAMLRLVLLSSALLRKGDDEVLQMPKQSWGSFVGLLQEYVEIHRTILRDVEFPMNNFQLSMFCSFFLNMFMFPLRMVKFSSMYIPSIWESVYLGNMLVLRFSPHVSTLHISKLKTASHWGNIRLSSEYHSLFPLK